jgi:large subunit ribosomal protein L15
MMIHEITELVGSHKKRKRLGRGIGSGHGKTCGRGTKGAGSRSGWGGSIRASREGGQMPFFRRIPKRGFSNVRFTTEYAVINIKALESRFEDGAEVNPDLLVKAGLLPDTKLPVKVLGEGELTKKLNVTAAVFSKSAAEKISKAGGTVTATQAA